MDNPFAIIRRYWGLLLIVASIFMSGYTVRRLQAQEASALRDVIDHQIATVEERVNQRITRIDQRVQETNHILIQILAEVKR